MARSSPKLLTPVFLLVALLTGSLAAQTPNLRVYSTQEGLPQIQVLSIHQDRTGYLWLGTYGGLTRYDAREFRTWTSDDGLITNGVLSLAEDPRGRLLIGTAAGLCRMEGEGFRCFDLEEHPPYRVDDLWSDRADPSGDVWAATNVGALRLRENELRIFDTADGLPSPVVLALDFHRGRLFAGTFEGLAVWKPNAGGGRFLPMDLGPLNGTEISAVRSTPNGLLAGGPAGLVLLAGEALEQKPVPLPPEISGKRIDDLVFDPLEGVWIAASQGLFLYRPDGTFAILGDEHGLPSEVIYGLEADREGNLWIGTDLGLVKRIPGPFLTFGLPSDLPDTTVRALALDPNRPGEMWLGTRHGLYHGRPGAFAAVDIGRLPDPRIYSLATDDDRTWIGSRSGLILLHGETLRRFTPEEDGLVHPLVLSLLTEAGDGRPQNRGVWLGTAGGLSFIDHDGVSTSFDDPATRLPIMALERGPRGRLWAGLHAGGLAIYDQEFTESGPRPTLHRRLGAEEGLTDFAVWSMDRHRDAVWIGTNGGGAFGLTLDDPIRIERLTTDDGLSNNFVWQVLWDSSERLWLFTNQGLDRFDRGSPFEHFDHADGLPTLEGAAAAVLEDEAGHIWLGTSAGAVRFDPKKERPNPVPPAVLIQKVTDAAGRPLSSGQSLGPDEGAFSVEVTALSFRHEDRVRFRYRLLGLDEATWSLPFSGHTLNFAGLGPGDYQLQVEAQNESGLWSREPAVFDLTVRPGFWDHPVAFALGLLALLGTVVFLGRLRLRHSEKERLRLESLVATRTRELETRNRRLGQEIEERQKAEEEHRRLESKIRQSEKMEAVGRLAGGVAHDFNNLLTTISGYAELLGHQLGTDDPARDDLEEIRRAARRAARLTHQLLAFSRKQDIAPTLLSLNSVVEEVGRMLRRLLGEHIDFSVRLKARSDTVRCDRSQLEQILVNLVLNARDSMADGGALGLETRDEQLPTETTDRLGHSMPAGDYVAVAVSDQGHGMDEATLNRIFEPFFTTKGETQGVGLGLATVYGAVRQNLGSIQVESAPGEGTTFTVRFPACDERPFDTETSGIFEAMPEGVGSTILVVEDEETVRGLISNVLSKLGYRVLEAPHGKAGLEAASAFEGAIDLLITDMVMPEMDGRTLAEELTRTRPELKVLFISGYPDDYLSRRGLLDAGNKLLHKPFSSKELAVATRESLEL